MGLADRREDSTDDLDEPTKPLTGSIKLLVITSGVPCSWKKHRSRRSRRSPDSGDGISRSKHKTDNQFGSRLDAVLDLDEGRDPCSLSAIGSPWHGRLDVHDPRQPQALGIEPGHCRRCWQTGGSTDLWHLAHLANRHCIVRTGNPVSYHLIVLLKAKGTATLWPDKVAVLHAWSRRGRPSVFVS